MEKLLLRGLALEQEWFLYGKGLSVKGFDYGKGPLQAIYLWKRLFVKELPFGVGSLQRDFCMEKAPCKGDSP